MDLRLVNRLLCGMLTLVVTLTLVAPRLVSAAGRSPTVESACCDRDAARDTDGPIAPSQSDDDCGHDCATHCCKPVAVPAVVVAAPQVNAPSRLAAPVALPADDVTPDLTLPPPKA